MHTVTIPSSWNLFQINLAGLWSKRKDLGGENMFRFKIKQGLAILACSAIAVGAMAQTSASSHSTLSAKSRENLNILESLSSLPAGEWRYHSGDLPHGESTTLDDASWKLVKPEFKAGNDTVWFRRTIIVPKAVHGYDPSGTHISFQFLASANGPVPEIIYFNGSRVALGDDLEPITLFDHTKIGDKVVIAVKLLQTTDEKSIRGAVFRMEPSSSRPSPADLREEALTAATMLPVVPGFKPEMITQVDHSISSIDTAALSQGNQAAFDASLKRVHTELLQFRPLLQQITIYEDGNSHIDAAWLWPWTETVDVVKRTWGTALQLMNEYPDYKFTQSAAAYNSWIADKYPVMNDEIKRRIKEGRWEIVGGMWVEPDLNMPDGESLVRQLLVGKRFFKKEYGVDVRVGWNPDSFGYTWQLPQIYKKSGVDYFVTQKMHWNDTNQLPLRLFWWESPDGSKVLTYFPTDYVHASVTPSRIAKDYVESVERNPGMTKMMDLYGIGDHGGGMTRTMLDGLQEWMKPGKVAPKLEHHTAQEYFSAVETHLDAKSPVWDYTSIAKGWTPPRQEAAGTMQIPTWKDELYFEYHRGVYTTQAAHKRHMRESEEALLDAEKYASLAWLTGTKYPTADFEDSWKKVTFNQFHDLAAGSGIGVIYRDAAEDYKHVFQQTHDADSASMPSLMASIDTRGPGVPVVVFNPLAWQRSNTVTVHVQMPEAAPQGIHLEDAKGDTLLSQLLSADAKTNSFTLLVRAQDVPSLGYTVLRAVAGQKPAQSDLHANGFTLENSLLKAVIDPKTGCITSLVEKKTGFETIAAGGCGNQLQTFADNPTKYDAWNIDPGTLDHHTSIDSLDSIKLVTKGPLRASIEIERTWQKSHFKQDIILEADSDHLQFDNHVDWHEDHVLLKAAFPLAATSAKATYEIPYGTIDRSTLRVNSFEKAQFEVPAMRFAELGDGQHGVAVLNQTKYGYDAVGNLLRLTLLRAPTWPDPVADRGPENFSYAVYPHAGDWKQAMTMRHGYNFNYPLQAFQAEAHDGSEAATHSYASIQQDNVVLTALKKAEDRDALVFRMFEWEGKSGDVKLQVPPGASFAVLSDLMENPQADHLKMDGNTVTVPVHPYEIVTVQVMYK